ncbi:MAG: hypothetical protein IJ834_06660 [Paludibacteraceae bacterium]|nr:hypothetical protein [Paludibacteraceae bacterium]
MPTFSVRNDLRTANVPITIRDDAEYGFRIWLISLAKRVGLNVRTILNIICQCTYQGEDGNWGDEYIENEAKEKLGNTAWYYVYDVVESLYKYIVDASKKQEYELEINAYFQTNGYGWKFENGNVLFRGNEIEEQAFTNAVQSLSTNQTAQSELKLALDDLSKRPIADTTGTVQHAMAAMECFCRQKFGGTTSTLGDIIQNNRSSFTPPLDKALEKLWGFASNHGRHVRNGGAATEEEAEFVLNMCSSLILYLSRSLP